MKTKTLMMTLATLTLIGAAGLALAQERHTPPDGGQPDMGAMLIDGLRKTEGCLGVDAGQFMSGKNTIVAWFENKQAVARWYHSPVHQHMMQATFGADGARHEPLAFVKDGIPLMVLASITFTDEPEIEGAALPISQISIELYSAQPGGAHINGRLAPPTFEVAHMRDYTPAPDEGTGTLSNGDR